MSRLNVSNLFNENEDGAPVVSGISTFSSPYYFVPPSGSTAQRPSNPGEGMIRFNTDSGHLEYYSGELWVDVITNNNELGDQNNTNSSGGTGTRGVYAIASNSSAALDYITIDTLGNAEDFGDLSDTSYEGSGLASRTRGVHALGYTNPATSNILEFVTIASTGNAINFGDLIGSSTRTTGACANQTRGIWGNGGPSMTNVKQAPVTLTRNFGRVRDSGLSITSTEILSADVLIRPLGILEIL